MRMSKRRKRLAALALLALIAVAVWLYLGRPPTEEVGNAPELVFSSLPLNGATNIHRIK